MDNFNIATSSHHYTALATKQKSTHIQETCIQTKYTYKTKIMQSVKRIKNQK